jgi:hypothetical protein
LTAIGGGSAAAGAVALGSLAAAGTGIGVELADRPGSNQPTAAQQAATVAQQQNALKATVANETPNYQASTEGGLSPGYIANQIGNVSGTGANISSLQDLVKQYLGGEGGGGGGGGLTTLPTGTPGTGSTTTSDAGGLTDLTQYLQAA